MSVEGHLHDLTVADLLGLVCRHRRPALLTIHSAGRTATLAVDAGRVLYARHGSVLGEEAVLEVLGWSEGEFVVGPVVDTPLRNVLAPLTDLLLRTARRDDPAPDATHGPPPARDDHRFDDELMEVIARLERDVARLEDPEVQRCGALALAVVEDILRRLLDFLGRWSAPWSQDELRVLVARQAERTPGLVGAEVTSTGISLGRTRGAAAAQPVFFRSAAAGTVGLVTSLLYRLTPRFAAPDRRVLWQDTFDAFVANLSHALELCRS